MFKKFEKRSTKSFVKNYKYTPKQFFYRLAIEQAGYEREKIPLDEYYKASATVEEKRDKAFVVYMTALAALFFYYVGQLDNFAFFGIELREAVLGHGLLGLTALATFQYALGSAKLQRYQALFHYLLNNSSGPQKQDLLLKYPRMFTSLIYFNTMSGGPRFMLPKRPYSRRVLILLVLLVPAILVWMLLTAYLSISVSIELWRMDSAANLLWSKLWIIGCWGLMLATLLLPTLSFIKIHFEHYGMTTMLERARNRDPERYKDYIEMIDNTILGYRLFHPDDDKKS